MDTIDIKVELQGGEKAKMTIAELEKYVADTVGTAGDAAQKFQELSAQLQASSKDYNDYAKELGDVTKATEEQTQRLAGLALQREKDKQALSEARRELTAHTKQLNAARGSYDEMNQMLGLLRNKYRQLSEEERKALGPDMLKQIQQLDAELKAIDATMGNFQRNVGNYPQAWAQVAQSAGSARNGFMAASAALNLFGVEGNEVTTILNSIQIGLAVVQKAAQGLPTIVSAMKAAKNAAIAFAGGLNVVKAALVSTGIGALVVGIGMLIANWDKITSLWRDDSAARKAEQAVKDMDAAIKASAETASKEGTQAAKDYAEALKSAGNNAEAVARAEATYQAALRETAKEQAKRNKAAADNAVLEAQVALADAKRQKDKEKIREQLNEALKAQQQADAELAKADLAIQQAETKAAVDAEKARTDAVKKGVEERKREREKEAEDARRQAEAERKAREADLEKVRSIQDNVYLQTLTNTERELELLRRKYDQERDLLEQYGESTAELTAQYEQKRLAILQAGADAESEESTRNRIALLDKMQANAEAVLNSGDADVGNPVERIQAQIEKVQELFAISVEFAEQKKAAIEEEMEREDLSMERMAELTEMQLALDQQIIDSKQKTNAKIAKLEAQAAKERKKMLQQQATQTLQSVGGMLTNVAGLFEEGSAANKAFQISGAIVNGIAGAATAYATAQELGPILGPIVGAANMTAVLASTAAQVAKIKSGSQDLSTSGTSASSSAAPSVSATPVVPAMLDAGVYATQLSTETGADIAAQQRDTRVYVVESDITDAQKAVKTKVSESTF